MSKGIMVEIPDTLYVSYRSERTVENEIYFTLYKQYVATGDASGKRREILTAPTVFIRGFEKLLWVEMPTPAEQEQQLRAAAERLVESLVVGNLTNTSASDWSVDYTYVSECQGITIQVAYMGTELEQDFAVKFSAGNFICNTRDTQKAVVLTVHTEGFSELFGDTEEYQDYRLSTNVQYAPCITSFTASYEEENYNDRVYVNLKYDNAVRFAWEIVGNGRIEHFLKRNEEIISEASAVDTYSEEVKEAAVYTLIASNQKGFSDVAQVRVELTRWKKVGTVSGLFDTPEEFVGQGGHMRLFCYKDNYYCYKDSIMPEGIMLPGAKRSGIMYQSGDGCVWEKFKDRAETVETGTDDSADAVENVTEQNGEAGENESEECVVCGMYGNKAYIMTGNVGGRLKILQYDFSQDQWSSSPAHQNCLSKEAALAFSSEQHYYGQVGGFGMQVCGNDNDDSTDSDWVYWNKRNFMISVQERNALYGDLCFWKDCFYSAMACEDGKIYFYKCSEDMEDAVFHIEKKGDWLALLPTTNQLLLVTEAGLYDAMAEKPVIDRFPEGAGSPWLGADKKHVFGIFGDGCFWIYEN